MVPPFTRAMWTQHSLRHVHRLSLSKDQLRFYKSQKRGSEVQKKRKYKAREKVAAEETAIAEGDMVQVNFELKH